jgi:putative transposase
MPVGPKSDAKQGPGRPPKFDETSLPVIKQVVIDHPTASMRELVDFVEAATGIRASQRTLRKALTKLGVENVSRPGPKAKRADTPQPSGALDEAKSGAAPFGYRPQHRDVPPTAQHTLGVSDAEWDLVADIFEDKPRGTPRKYMRRAMVDAMLYVLRGGIQWRALPGEFPPWHQVYKTYRRWERQGRFRKAMGRLRRMWRERTGRNEEPTGAVVDSQSVATSAQGGPKGYDAGKKIKGRKRHLMTDTLGLLLAVVLLPANVQDRDAAAQVVAAGMEEAPTVAKLYADSGYEGTCREALEAAHKGLSVEIIRRDDNRNIGYRVPKDQPHLFPDWIELERSKRGFKVLPKRWVIERTNGWNLRSRRLTRDQDRTLEAAEGWLWLASVRTLLRRLAHGEDSAA